MTGEDEFDSEETTTLEAPVADEVDMDTASDVLSDAVKAKLFGGGTIANRPDISSLPDAFDHGRPMFQVGDKVVIERYATMLASRPYLDTKTYKVVAIDTDTGNMRLWDDQLGQFAGDNFKTGFAAGTRTYKIAMGVNVSTKKKRGRPRKNPIVALEEAKPAAPVEKKKRGRPPGSKNRSREVVLAEKAAKKMERDERKARRAVKKKSK